MKSLLRFLRCPPRWWLLLLLLSPQAPLAAYLDPGSGSVLLSVLIGSVSLGYFLLRDLWHRLKGWRFKGQQHPPIALLLFSEGRQYWPLFRPLVEELCRREQACSYWSMDPQDPGLQFNHPLYQSRNIGQGHHAYHTLNFAQADVCVMTTPGLDVLQLRRSRKVKHYCHLMHAPTDIHSYLLFSFDYYDSVLLSGPHQEASLRELESKRGTSAKQLLPTGLLYYDQISPTAPEQGREHPRILLAPTWGEKGLLHQNGSKVLLSLLDQGYQVWLRPHPQSFISEAALLDRILTPLKAHPLLHLDRGTDVFASLSQVDLLISDFSGIVFDAAFVAEKPVITIGGALPRGAFEAVDLQRPAWEFQLLPQLGARLDWERLAELPQLVASTLSQQKQNLGPLREQSVYHYRHAAPVAARHLQHILHNLQQPAAAATQHGTK